MSITKIGATALLLAALSGCAIYPISKDLRQQSKIITMAQVKADPEGTRGTTVIWGGRIVNVVDATNGGEIYIACLPMGSDEKPNSYGPSPGRFIAISPDYLDPEMFSTHTRITVAGELDGVRTEQLGAILYTYPVLLIRETHVWPIEPYEPYEPYYDGYSPYWSPAWYWGPGWWWGGGFYYPYYYGGFHGGYHEYHGGFHTGSHRGFRGHAGGAGHRH